MTELLSCETCAYRSHKTRTWTDPVPAYRGASPTPLITPKVHTYTWIECHRYPPTVVVHEGEVQQHYPVVEPDDLCGEWSAKFK